MMFIWTIWALTYRRTHNGVNRHSGMIVVACLMLLFSTTVRRYLCITYRV